MDRLYQLLTVFFIVGAFVFSITVGLRSGDQNDYSSRVSEARGTVLNFEAGLLIISFSEQVVNSCGDTQIYGFVTTPDDFTLQLKPVFIPEAKANTVDQTLLVFPVWDIMAFLQTEGGYTLEFFIDNNCSLFHNKTITLPPVPLVLDAGDPT